MIMNFVMPRVEDGYIICGVRLVATSSQGISRHEAVGDDRPEGQTMCASKLHPRRPWRFH